MENRCEYFWRDFLTGSLTFWRFGTEVREENLDNTSEYFWRDFLTGSLAFRRSEKEVREENLGEHE